MNRFAFASLAAGLGIALVSGPAAAVVVTPNPAVFTAASAGTAAGVVTREYNGIVEGSVLAGLIANITFSLLSVSGSTWNFSAFIDNNLPGSVDGRIATIGFSTTPNFTGVGLGSGPFNRALTYDNVNFPQTSTDIELCFASASGRSPGNCSGGGSGGVLANSTATQFFSLNFGGVSPTPVSIALENFIIRWQSLPGGASGIGITRLPDPVDPGGGAVPEPASWAMLIAGFGLIGAAQRRRRPVAA